MVKSKFYLSIIVVMTCLLVACGSENEIDQQEDDISVNEEVPAMNENILEDEQQANEEADEKMVETVSVPLLNGQGETIGHAELTEESEGVKIKVEASNLTPGLHGFHIHETGKCDAPTFKSAGGHFNPTNANHGLEDDKGPHSGDFPNLEVGEDGKVEIEIHSKNLTLKKGEEHSLFKPGGTAFIIHADADDGKSQPAGNAGDRIVCGVISE